MSSSVNSTYTSSPLAGTAPASQLLGSLQWCGPVAVCWLLTPPMVPAPPLTLAATVNGVSCWPVRVTTAPAALAVTSAMSGSGEPFHAAASAVATPVLSAGVTLLPSTLTVLPFRVSLYVVAALYSVTLTALICANDWAPPRHLLLGTGHLRLARG